MALKFHFSECQVCPAPGQVCDPVTGDCVCPPNTVGEMCENCTKNAWNYHPLKGCTLCDCSKVGADGPECNPLNGQVFRLFLRNYSGIFAHITLDMKVVQGASGTVQVANLACVCTSDIRAGNDG